MPHASGNSKSYDVPYGKGSLYSHLSEAQQRTQQRAVRLNRGIDTKLKTYESMINRHRNAVEDKMDKVSKRIQRNIEEMIAYQQVLQQMRVSDLKIMDLGFSPRDIKSPRTFQRYKLERRIMSIGFSMKSLHPQIVQTMDETRPEKKREEERQKQLEEARKLSNFTIDRKVTNEAMRRERMLDSLSLGSDGLQECWKDGMPAAKEDIKLKTLKYQNSETFVTVHKHTDKVPDGIDEDAPRGLKTRPLVIGTFQT